MFILELGSIQLLKSLIIDFFRRKHVKNIVWKEEIEWLELNELLAKTIDSKMVVEHNIDLSYRKKFLKFLKHNWRTLSLHTPYFRSFVDLYQMKEETEYHGVCYPIFEIKDLDSLTEVNAIILKESNKIITHGTTGLVTWQAAQALAEWGLTKSFENKTILELGSGVGFTGLVVTSLTPCKKYIFTDYHPKVLSLLKYNVKLNCDETLVDEENPVGDMLFSGSIKDCKVEIRKLVWECLGEIGSVDLIFTADIMYEDFIHLPFINTVKFFLENGAKAAIIAFARRNRETVRLFRNTLDTMGLKIKDLEKVKPHYLSWATSPVVEIIEVTTYSKK